MEKRDLKNVFWSLFFVVSFIIIGFDLLKVFIESSILLDSLKKTP